MPSNNLDRIQTVPDLEIGVSEALRRHLSRHVVEKPISQRILDFERRRPDWLRACVAEATGVFFYVYAPKHAEDLLRVQFSNSM